MTAMVERWRSLEALVWRRSFRPWIGSDTNRVVQGSERFLGVRDDLIVDEDIVYWLRRAVVLGDDDDDACLPLVSTCTPEDPS
jgi:hypothetical protein